MNEVLRKIVHVSGLLLIPAYLYLGKNIIILILLISILISSVFEFFRIKFRILTGIFREYEKRRFASYFYYLLAIFIVTVFFSKEAYLSAIICSNVGDFIAGIVRKWKDQFSSIFMFISTSTLFLILNYYFSIVSAAAATLVERFKKLEDNFTVPIVAAVVTDLIKYFIIV